MEGQGGMVRQEVSALVQGSDDGGSYQGECSGKHEILDLF